MVLQDILYSKALTNVIGSGGIAISVAPAATDFCPKKAIRPMGTGGGLQGRIVFF